MCFGALLLKFVLVEHVVAIKLHDAALCPPTELLFGEDPDLVNVFLNESNLALPEENEVLGALTFLSHWYSSTSISEGKPSIHPVVAPAFAVLCMLRFYTYYRDDKLISAIAALGNAARDHVRDAPPFPEDASYMDLMQWMFVTLVKQAHRAQLDHQQRLQASDYVNPVSSLGVRRIPALIELLDTGALDGLEANRLVDIGASAWPGHDGVDGCFLDPGNCLLSRWGSPDARPWRAVLVEGRPTSVNVLRKLHLDRPNVSIVSSFVLLDTVGRLVDDAFWNRFRERVSCRDSDWISSEGLGACVEDEITLLKIDIDNGDCDMLEQVMHKLHWRPKVVMIEAFQWTVPPPLSFRQTFSSRLISNGQDFTKSIAMARGCSLQAAADIMSCIPSPLEPSPSASSQHEYILITVGQGALNGFGPNLEWVRRDVAESFVASHGTTEVAQHLRAAIAAFNRAKEEPGFWTGWLYQLWREHFMTDGSIYSPLAFVGFSYHPALMMSESLSLEDKRSVLEAHYSLVLGGEAWVLDVGGAVC